ncbi:MAG TPA: hypothetical protein VGE79_12150, partial [Niastella sp.]
GGDATASAWEAVLPGMRLTLTLSPDASRGFSGEGGVLDALATDEAAECSILIPLASCAEAAAHAEMILPLNNM